jgi:3,4-dihydroxy 2-butanone 4-phosphate synthase/GTP cyclohydrolase II
LGGTAFTVSIDVKGRGVTTGISAHDRANTIKAAIEIGSRREDFAAPGHVFPLRARAGGVLERRGHTEAAVDLATLAGFSPAGVICEILNDDGTMARTPDLVRFCRRHNLAMITVADLVRHRVETDPRPRTTPSTDYDSYALPWPSRPVLPDADGARVSRETPDFSGAS